MFATQALALILTNSDLDQIICLACQYLSLQISCFEFLRVVLILLPDT